MRVSLKIYFVLLAGLLTMQGCFDIKREIKIYPNGSGYEKIYVTLEGAVFDIYKMYASHDTTGRSQRMADIFMDDDRWQQMITNDYLRAPGISLKDVRITPKESGSKEIFIHYTFDDPSALIRTVKEATFEISNKQNVSFSTIKFFDEGDRLRFKYLLRNASRSYDESTGLSMFESQIQSKRVNYIIEMPFDVDSTNASIRSGNTLEWDFPLSDILYNQAEMTAVMRREPGIDLPYAEKIDRTIQALSKSKNPLIRVQLYNANQEPVKVGTGIILKEDLVVTNFKLLTLIEGQGYFSIILNDNSLAGVDEMKEKDYDRKIDIAFFRFNNNEPTKTLKLAQLSGVAVKQNVKIIYFPNTLSSTAYSMDGTVAGIRSWGKKNKVIEIKPAKPVSLEGGAVFDEKGDLIGMITTAYEGEIGKLYVVPSDYIRTRLYAK